MKLKRTPCNLGWTDHAFRRFKEAMWAGRKWDKKTRYGFKRKRLIGVFNKIVFRKPKKFPF